MAKSYDTLTCILFILCYFFKWLILNTFRQHCRISIDIWAKANKKVKYNSLDEIEWIKGERTLFKEFKASPQEINSQILLAYVCCMLVYAVGQRLSLLFKCNKIRMTYCDFDLNLFVFDSFCIFFNFWLI